MNPYGLIGGFYAVISFIGLLDLGLSATGISEVKRLVPELYAQGITPSVKNLASVMTNPEALWREEVLETPP
ncbi:hypothetical protein Riv7116_5051 [Rivularia sp. PCC 7116]|uniref:hypothetical protein n=1 Tax=Rivularia sp. PCC 7116 TaxID=373994 RepID=UPI00029F3105|nr:hypothetical protein [Rivularia sp. PCC 7116]AFY57453.1 hypothetical protein Riv7116_5051 [Rivularia sp. PCC 7116]